MKAFFSILLENTIAGHRSLKAEHGLSIFICIDSKKILFDFGASSSFVHNAEMMNISLDNPDFAVCSHAHYDHSTGLKNLVSTYNVDNLLTGRNFLTPKYEYDGNKYTYLGPGFDKSYLDSHGIKHKECYDLIQLTEHCWAVSNFKRTYPFENIPEEFLTGETAHGSIKDRFNDELCLIIETPEGLNMITGCSHPGILNMVSTVSNIFGKKIIGVFGGLHLMNADEKRIKKTIKELKVFGVKKAGFCHCSGSIIKELVKSEKDFEGYNLSTGDIVIL